MKKTLRHILIFVLFIQSAMTLAVAQPQCVPFESLPVGETYGPPAVNPGDTLMTFDDVVVSFDLFQNSVGGNQFFGLSATESPFFLDFTNAEGTMLYFQNIGLTFDFSSREDSVLSLSLDYANVSGKEKNLQVNGATFHIVDDFDDIPPEVAPGVFVNHESLNPQEGSLEFCGNIQTLRLGGVQFHLDNVCYGISDPVWPGDANNNNKVDHYDLLNIGLAFRSIGCPRDSVTSDWMPYPATDWFNTLPSGLNYKYADCNGDGEIFEDPIITGDFDVFSQNFGETNDNVIPLIFNEGDEEDPPLVFDTRNPNANNEPKWANDNEPFLFPLMMGIDTLPVDEIYGVAFDIEFDPAFLDANSIELDFSIPNNLFGTENQDFVAIYNTDSVQQGKVFAAMTRIDQTDVGGFGPVLNMTGIIVDVVGFSDVQVTNVRGITSSGSEVIFQTPISEFEVVDSITTSTGPDIEAYSRNVKIYPNPARDVIHIENSNQENISSIKFYSTLGQLIREVNNPGVLTNLSVRDLEPGIYMLEIKFDNFVVCKKLKIS